MQEVTLAMIKPHDDSTGEMERSILLRVLNAGMSILHLEKMHLTLDQVTRFYIEHVDKDFFKDHAQYMISGPVTVLILSGEDAVLKWRRMMGATDPKEAERGTIRHRFGCHNELPRNVVHGSDSVEAAER
jgi:nucleoside-diphosphate kinase